uniref:Ionotropic glutamate receptor C-terminal domain-containing protein n=4 Tax=Clytia hemisphaerica TaxID=252671 RepID=A0A7M5WX81_9CNID
MVSDVVQNKADVIIAPFLMTRDRLLALDFTDESYLNGGMALVTVAQKSNMTLFNFRTFQPLSASMWFVLLSLTLAASLIVYFAEKLSIKTPVYPLWESVNYFTGLAFARDIGALNPVKLGSRVIGISVALFMLIVMSTYTAVLTSNMVASTVSLPIHGLKDEKIINPTASFKFGTQLNTGYVEYFDPKRDPSFQKTFLFMKRYNYADTSQAIRDLKSG